MNGEDVQFKNVNIFQWCLEFLPFRVASPT